MAVNIGPKIGIEGEAEYRRQINNIIQQAKTLASEMKAVTESFGKNATAQEKATAAAKVLEKQVETQRQRVQALTDMLNKASKETGENSTETLKWQQAVNEATAELKRMERELDSSVSASRDVGEAVDDTADSMKKAGDEAFSFGDSLRSNILAQAIVDGVKRLASEIKGLAKDMIETAASVKAETSQFGQTFGDMGDTASRIIGQIADNTGILQTRLNTVASGIYAFARSSGGDATESLDLMEKALQAAADGAAYYDRSLDDVVDQLQSFLKGNYANDAALGVSATETTRNAEAMKLFGQKFQDLTEIQKQQTLLQMVLDAQELSGAMGQAAREADGWENVQGNLNESIRQLQAHAGEPFLEALVPIVQQITDKIIELTQNTDWEAFSSSVQGFLDGVEKNGPTAVSVVAGIGAGFVTWNVASMIQGVITAVKAFKTANEGASIAQALLNQTIKANPIGLLVSLIAGLVAALITAYQTNEDFRNKVNVAWNSVKNTISGVVSAIVGFFTQSIPNASRSAIDFLKSLPSQALGWGKDMISGFADGIMSKANELLDRVRSVASSIRSFLHFSRPDEGPLRDYETWMPDMMRGLAKGIQQKAYLVRDVLDNVTGDWSIPVPTAPIPAFAGGYGGMSMAGGKTTNLGGVTINVYGAEGQDEEAIANYVMQKIQTQVDQEGDAWK